MRVLVTGGAGFVGTHLCRELTGRGDAVQVLDSFEEQVHGSGNDRVQNRSYRDGHVAVLRGYVSHRDTVRLILEETDAVVHLAAVVGVGQSMYDIERYVRRNCLDTAVLLEEVARARKGLRRLVVASSMSCYGEGPRWCAGCGDTRPRERTTADMLEGRWGFPCPRCEKRTYTVPVTEDAALHPTSVYATTKRDQEELCLQVGAAYGVPTAALRFFNIYGPGQSLSNPYTGAAAIFASRLLNGRAPVVFEDGEQSRDLIHVSDVVRGVLLALDADYRGAINLGTGRPTSVRRVAEILSDELLPGTQPELNGRFRAGDIRDCHADTFRAQRELGFRTKVSVEDGLRELARDVRDEVADDRVDEHLEDLRTRGLAT